VDSDGSSVGWLWDGTAVGRLDAAADHGAWPEEANATPVDIRATTPAAATAAFTPARGEGTDMGASLLVDVTRSR
jgi:hypothetical protein